MHAVFLKLNAAQGLGEGGKRKELRERKKLQEGGREKNDRFAGTFGCTVTLSNTKETT